MPASVLHGLPSGKVVKNPPANARDLGDTGSIPGSEASPAERSGNLFQYSCWEIPWTVEPGASWGHKSDMTDSN